MRSLSARRPRDWRPASRPHLETRPSSGDASAPESAVVSTAGRNGERMAETIDVQEQAIGAGSMLALAFVGYGRFISETVVGVDATALGIGAFAATFGAVALIHGAYGRRDFAVAHGLAAVGMFLVALAGSPLRTLAGLVLLAGGGGYVALVTVRTRSDEREVASENA